MSSTGPTHWSEVIPGLWQSHYNTASNIPACAIATRLADGGLLVLSPPVAANDAFFAATDKLGKVAVLVAPNVGHDLGQASWQAKYPNAECYAPEAAIAGIAKAKPMLRAFRPLGELAARTGDKLRIEDVPGTSSGLMLLSLNSGEQRALVLDDPLSNTDALFGPAIFKVLFWLTGSAPGLKRNKIWWMAFAKDKRRVASAIVAEFDRLKPTVVVPLHGALVSGDQLATVRSLFADLVR